MKKILMASLSLLSLLVNAEGVVLSEKTVIRELVASNPGQEIIVPYTSLNTAKTQLSMRFDIYPVGSTTKLFSTPIKTFVLQAMPECTVSPGIYGWFAGLVSAPNGGANQVYSYQLQRSCSLNVPPYYTNRTDNYLYGANVTSSSTKWGLAFEDSGYINQMLPVNSDADADYELMIEFNTPKNIAKSTTKKRVQIVNLVTGAIEVAAKDRTIMSDNLAPQVNN